MNILEYGKLVSCQEYIINSSGLILSCKYHNDNVSVDSQLLVDNKIASYTTNITKDESNLECSLAGIPDYVKALHFFNAGKDIHDNLGEAATIIYTANNAKIKNDNDFVVTLTSLDGSKDYDISVFNGNYIAYNYDYAQEIDKDGDIVKHYELFDDGFAVIEFDENINITSLSRYVIRDDESIYPIEISNFSIPSVCLSNDAFDLSERAENINIDNIDIKVEYDEFGIPVSDSNDCVMYERCYDNEDQTETSDIVSIHPLYYDLYNLNNVFDGKLFCQDQIVFHENGYIFTRTIVECDIEKYDTLTNINKIESDEPLIDFIDYDEIYDEKENN